ncbi:MAG: RNA polymerase factor sigma-32 [Alphaproteobacteria bacterium]|nr:RNA polymerase factor sigma-32 [Alphaproteobacteria bacterium]
MSVSGSGTPDAANRKFVSAMMAKPLLERDREFELARAWRDEGDEEALHELVTAYGRFVVRIAWRFRGYGLPINDLIQEGNIGLMEAAARFDADREARFSTYASWWIMAAIQDHILRNTSIVRVATTPAQRRLFFNLRRLRAKLAGRTGGNLTSADHRAIAATLKVKPIDVERMAVHLGKPDMSLNAPLGTEEDGAEQIDFLPDLQPTPEQATVKSLDREAHGRMIEEALDELTPRERQIIIKRFLEEDKSTLADIGTSFGVSKERIRQLEARALQKLRTMLEPRISAAEIGELSL